MQTETKREYIKSLKNYFRKEHASDFTFGATYLGSSDYSYFSLTTRELKERKLKFVIVFNYKLMCFEICLSGQNKNVRKKYWQLFKSTDWDAYPLVESIDDSLAIINHIMRDKFNLDNPEKLTTEIETEALKFIDEIQAFFEL